jgi:phosphoglycerate dehydrogenase-like enzyme
MEIIVFLERDTLRAEVRRLSFEHVRRDYGSTRPEKVLERLEGATVAVVNKLPLGADVLSVEPPREGNPLLDPTLPNLIVTPHVAWAGREAQQALADRLVANIEAFVEKKY